MIRLIGQGNVLIKEFLTEEEALAYMHSHKIDLERYYSHYEVVIPGEETIWSVADELIPANQYERQMDEKRRIAAAQETEKEEGWGDEGEE